MKHFRASRTPCSTTQHVVAVDGLGVRALAPVRRGSCSRDATKTPSEPICRTFCEFFHFFPTPQHSTCRCAGFFSLWLVLLEVSAQATPFALPSGSVGLIEQKMPEARRSRRAKSVRESRTLPNFFILLLWYTATTLFVEARSTAIGHPTSYHAGEAVRSAGWDSERLVHRYHQTWPKHGARK